MTTVYSPAALLIIALSVLLVLVILLTVISFCVYVATGRSLFSFRKRASRETPELFALQEMWRQSYWWINANWAVLNEMAHRDVGRLPALAAAPERCESRGVCHTATSVPTFCRDLCRRHGERPH